MSDSNSNTDFREIRPREILSKVASLPFTTRHYKHNQHRLYIGPTAEDFRAAFGFGSDDKTISVLNNDSVFYAVIQGLVEELKERNRAMAARSDDQRTEGRDARFAQKDSQRPAPQSASHTLIAALCGICKCLVSPLRPNHREKVCAFLKRISVAQSKGEKGIFHLREGSPEPIF